MGENVGVIDPDGCETRHERRPFLSAVHRDIEPEFRAEEEQVRRARVLLDHVDVPAHAGRAQRPPRLAVVARVFRVNEIV